MVVRVRRTRSQQRARTLLSLSLLLPAAGFLQAAGINPISVGGAMIFVIASLVAAYAAFRPILVILRSGITIGGALGSSSVSLSWREIKHVELTPGAVSLTTTGLQMYQIQVNRRTGEFICRMVERALLSGDN